MTLPHAGELQTRGWGDNPVKHVVRGRVREPLSPCVIARATVILSASAAVLRQALVELHAFELCLNGPPSARDIQTGGERLSGPSFPVSHAARHEDVNARVGLGLSSRPAGAGSAACRRKVIVEREAPAPRWPRRAGKLAAVQWRTQATVQQVHRGLHAGSG